MVVHEIFRSIQGESTFAGRPCTFIRLSGCNLRCVWCDTPYAWHQGSEYTLPDIMKLVRIYPADLMEITGGEPLLQADTPRLCALLLESGATVLLETNGSQNIDLAPMGVHRIMDIKTPSSQEQHSFDEKNIARLRRGDEIKFVIGDRTDMDYALSVTETYALSDHFPVLFSPMLEKLAPHQLAKWILDSGKPVRLQMQLHKIIWDPEKRGV